MRATARRWYAVGGLFVLAAGCGNFPQAVRARAANDFGCPTQSVALTPARSFAQPQAYRAEGCGQSQDYEGGCDLAGCLVDKVPSPEAQAVLRASRGARRTAPVPASGPGPNVSPGAQLVSLSLHNVCPQTVRLFFGNTPKFGSGIETSISSNSIENHSMREGDMIWIIDQSGNGMSSMNANRGQTRVIITRSCTGFAPE